MKKQLFLTTLFLFLTWNIFAFGLFESRSGPSKAEIEADAISGFNNEIDSLINRFNSLMTDSTVKGVLKLIEVEDDIVIAKSSSSRAILSNTMVLDGAGGSGKTNGNNLSNANNNAYGSAKALAMANKDAADQKKQNNGGSANTETNTNESQTDSEGTTQGTSNTGGKTQESNLTPEERAYLMGKADEEARGKTPVKTSGSTSSTSSPSYLLPEPHVTIESTNLDVEALNTAALQFFNQLGHNIVALFTPATNPDKSNNENSLEKQAEDENRKESTQAGDPVYVTTGQYADYITDYSIKYLRSMFDISRTYTSDESIDGSFGTNWLSSLDTRLIFGTYGVTFDDCALYYEEVVRYAEKQCEDFFNTIYELSGIHETYISYTSTRIDLFYHSFVTLFDDALDLYGRIDSYSFQYQDSSSLINLVSQFLSYIQDGLDLSLELFEMMKNLDSISQELRSDCDMKKDYYLTLLEMARHDDIVTPINAPAIFPGTPDHYMHTGKDIITLIDESGKPHAFRCKYDYPDPAAIPVGMIWKPVSPGIYRELIKTTDGFTLIKLDNSSVSFSESGLLDTVTDAYGNWITFKRDESEKIVSIETVSGRTYTINWSGSHICSISADGQTTHTVSFTYNGNKLSSVTDEEGDAVSYKWSNGLLSSIVKPDGSSIDFFFDKMDKDNRLLATETRNEENYSEFFDYDFTKNTTLHTDHSGVKTLYEYDENYNTTKITYSDGRCISMEYDENGDMISEKFNGNVITYQYNKNRWKIAAIYSDGSTERWFYDEAGNVIKFIDRDGCVYEYKRNLAGDIISCVMDDILYKYISYYPNGLIESEITQNDYDAIRSYYFYTDDGYLKKVISGDRTEEWEWDSEDNLSRYTIDGVEYSRYWKDGKVTKSRDYSNLESTYISNDRKDVIQVIEKDTLTSETRIHFYEYDDRHLLSAESVGNGKEQTLLYRIRYDGEGRKEAEISYRGEAAIITFVDYRDKNGEPQSFPLSKKRFTVSAENVNMYNLSSGEGFKKADLTALSKKADEISSISYDLNYLGNGFKYVICADSRGFSSTYLYDSWDRLVSVSDLSGIKSQMSYSNAGRILDETNEFGGSTRYHYCGDYFEKKSFNDDIYINENYILYPKLSLISSINEIYLSDDSHSTHTEYKNIRYNQDGNVSLLVNENGTESFFYDGFGRLIKKYSGYNDLEVDTTSFTTYDFNDSDRTLTVTEGHRFSTFFELNAWGEPVSITDGNGNKTVLKYDYAGNIISVTDPYGYETTYKYNQAGQQTEIIYPDSSFKRFEYSLSGNLAKVTDQTGVTLIQEYDEAGNLIHKAGKGIVDTRYKYDDRNRVISIFEGETCIQRNDYSFDSRIVTRYDAKGNPAVSYYDDFGYLMYETDRNNVRHDADKTDIFTYSVYDPAGNILCLHEDHLDIIYSYDEAGHLTDEMDNLAHTVIHYDYDPAGNRISMSEGSRTVYYTYGKNNELIKLEEYDEGKPVSSVSFTYDCLGREISRAFSNGIIQTIVYDDSGNIVLRFQKDAAGKLLFGEGFMFDENNRIAATVTSEGYVSIPKYDNRGRVISMIETDTAETAQKEWDEAVMYGLISQSSSLSASKSTYTLSTRMYNELKSLLSAMDKSAASRLSIQQTVRKTEYAYDENSNRISKKTVYGIINYTYDAENRMISAGNHILTYDEEGNLLKEISPYRTAEYEYSDKNRMISSSVSDVLQDLNVFKKYGYDTIGRRITEESYDVTSKGKQILTDSTYTEYDGFSFDIVKQTIRVN